MKTKLLMLMIFTCILLVGNALARELPTVRQIEDPTIQTIGISSDRDQLVGNLNDPTWLVNGWFIGNEEYKYLFDPTLQLDCEEGFLLETVHMLVNFDETMVPVTFEVWVDLEDAAWDPDTSCWIPGVEDCVSEIMTFTIEEPGTYDLAVPIDCQCAYMTYPDDVTPYMYLLSMHFIGEFPMGLITDDLPTPCTNYNNWGDGWVDLFDYFANAGNIIMWGDVVCCNDPIATEKTTFDAIKSLFR